MKPLLAKENIYLSVTRGMKVSAHQVKEYGLGVEIQDFALLSGMRANLEENLKFWREFLEIYKPALTFHAPFVDRHHGSPKEREREFAFTSLIAAVKVAKELGAILVNLHTGWPPESAKKFGIKSEWNHIFNNLRQLAEEAQKLEIEIVIENVFEHDPELLVKLNDEIAIPNIGLCLDTGHANIMGKVPPDEWVNILGERLKYIHLHDNDGKKDRHWALGDGNIDLDAFVDALFRNKYSGKLCIETWPLRWDKSIDFLVSKGVMAEIEKKTG